MIQHPDYIIKNEIGRGGMATVYLAYDQVFKCEVAIKILNKEFLFNDHVKNRFLDEARKLYRMNHPNIIRVTRIIEENENVGFVMEYFDAVTIKELIEQQGKLAQDQIIRLMVQMLDALKYVHYQGMVHRDVKPSNFMVERNGILKLLDFGIAKNNDSNSSDYTQTAASYQLGTPMYMSPEQINESRNVTAQSDIYSLGVTLWYMVTGERPYDSESLSTFQLLSKIVNEQLKVTHSVFQPIIEKCTAKELSKRYTDCDKIKEDLLCIGPKVTTQSLPEILFEGPNKTSESGHTEHTLFVDFEKDNKKATNQGFFKKTKTLIIFSLAALLIVSVGILISTQKKQNKPDGISSPKAFPVNNDSLSETTDSAPIVFDSIVTISDTTFKQQQLITTTKTNVQSKKAIPLSLPKSSSNQSKQATVDSSKPQLSVVSTQTNNPPSSEPNSTLPSNDPVKKETKLKKTLVKLNEKVKKVFRKKEKKEK
jgi:serine/threonine protein kinase